MNTTDIILALIIAITIILVVWSWVMASFIDRTEKALKDIADNQFDAEEVMRLYQMKYNIPRIICAKPNIVELNANFSLPYEYRNEITEEEIHLQLTKDLTEYLGEYVEVAVHKNIVRMTTEYRARLRVIKPADIKP